MKKSLNQDYESNGGTGTNVDHNWILKQRASQTNPNLEEENGKEAHDMTRHMLFIFRLSFTIA